MKEIIVNDKYDNKKLNNVLLKVFPALNSNSIYKALRKKDIRINNVRVSENVTVHSGDSIKIFISDDVLLGVKNAPKITKIFEDENIIHAVSFKLHSFIWQFVDQGKVFLTVFGIFQSHIEVECLHVIVFLLWSC